VQDLIFLQKNFSSIDEMDEKQISLRQLFQARCLKEKGLSSRRRHNGNPNHVFGEEGNNFSRRKGLSSLRNKFLNV
jgi:hypothetical protein